MITVNGKKMGKSYNNQIKLTEMFSGNHPLLKQPYSPMTIRFFILQTHYSSTLDFSNEALQAAEKGLKRLWESYEIVKKLIYPDKTMDLNRELDDKLKKGLLQLDEFMNDDFNTAKVLANLFEIVPVINSIKNGQLNAGELNKDTFVLLQKYFSDYLENILGLRSENFYENGVLDGVLELVIDMRKEAKTRKDYATSDEIRNRLQHLGILVKDEKDGGMSYTFE